MIELLFRPDMVPYLHTMGYAVRAYDEHGKSAGTLYRRKKAVGMLADLEAGRINGIAVVEVSRLTRDEYSFDAPLIGEKIRRFGHGLLISYGQLWDLRREADWQLYQIQTMASGWQKLSIRKYLFQGLKRAAEDRPMFRKRNRIGYKREVVRDSHGEPIIRRNGRVYRVFVKDLTWADSLEALLRELNQQGTMPDVAEALNAAGVPAPWVPRGIGERVWQWRGDYIRSIIKDPLYYGEPAFMTGEPGPVWDQFIAVDPNFDPRKVHWKLPELAWWTKVEALAWPHKFLDDYVKSRHRKHHHLLLGMLLCQTCGKKLVKQGIDRTGDRYYRCPGYGIKGDDARHCPRGQFVMEKKALQLLREHALPVLFADVRALAEAAERNATTPCDESAKRKELESLNERERNLLAQPSGPVSLTVASSPASMTQWLAEANRLRAAPPADVQQTLLEHEAAGTTSSPAYEAAMLVFYRAYVCRADPWPDGLVRSFDKLQQNPEVYYMMNGPSEFHVVGSLKDWDIVNRLGEIHLPTLITSSRYDEATPAIAEVVHKGIAGSEWVMFEASAHCAHAEEADRYAQVLDSFLSRVEKLV
jgi:ssDNA-binding Zn-finger/Zn-ribbon topoisomerase 1